MEDLQRYKEAHRPGPINLPPRKLGGCISEHEARQQQQIGLRQSKYQQQLKRDEYKQKQKEEEEAEIQRRKAIQRAKAIKLEEKGKQQEKQRRQTFEEDHYQKNNALFSRLDMGSNYRDFYQNDNFGTESNSWGQESNPLGREANTSVQQQNSWARSHAYGQARKEEEQRRLQQMKDEQQRKSELLEFKRKQDEKEKIRTHQSEQRRVNNAFLDRLERANQPGIHQSDYFWNTE